MLSLDNVIFNAFSLVSYTIEQHSMLDIVNINVNISQKKT